MTTTHKTHTKRAVNEKPIQGLKKVSSVRPGQVDFPARQVTCTFHCHLPNGQGSRQGVWQLNKKKSTKTSPRQAKSESCMSEGQAEFKFFQALMSGIK